jgi:hypothetical protein
MAKFEVREVFRLSSRGQLVIAGIAIEGTVATGMNARVWLDGGAYWSLPIEAVEYIDRPALKESLIGLVCPESHPSDAEVCQTLCPLGTVIEIAEPST